jgi:hypothetical protein
MTLAHTLDVRNEVVGHHDGHLARRYRRRALALTSKMRPVNAGKRTRRANASFDAQHALWARHFV